MVKTPATKSATFESAVAELDFDALAASRRHAQVANDRDWPAQLAPALERATVAGFAPVAG